MKYHDETSTDTYELLGAAGEGGEGTVYEVAGYPGVIAKLYTRKRLEQSVTDPTTGRQWNVLGKITHMAHRGLSPWVEEDSEQVLAIAWPQVPLFDDAHNFVGFLMPQLEASVPGEDCPADLNFAYRSRERRYLFGDGYTWLTSVKIAMNLATVVRYLHENGIIIGDFNCNNILVDQDAHVKLIDTDSFCISNQALGVTYQCIVGVGEFLAPELQGQSLLNPHARRMFTQESDCFSLAIHIFMLLMDGTHPFSRQVAGQSRTSSSTEPYVQEIASGSCPYVTGAHMQPVAGQVSIEMLPSEIRSLFDRAFSYDADTARSSEMIQRRPTAREWEEALHWLYYASAEANLECPHDPSHKAPPNNRLCPWCACEGREMPLQVGKRSSRMGGRLLIVGLSLVLMAVVAAAVFFGLRVYQGNVAPPVDVSGVDNPVDSEFPLSSQGSTNSTGGSDAQGSTGMTASPDSSKNLTMNNKLSSGRFQLDSQTYGLACSTLADFVRRGWIPTDIKDPSMTNVSTGDTQPSEIDPVAVRDAPETVELLPGHIYHEFVLTNSLSEAQVSVALQNLSDASQSCLDCKVVFIGIADDRVAVKIPNNGWYMGITRMIVTNKCGLPQSEEDFLRQYWHSTLDQGGAPHDTTYAYDLGHDDMTGWATIYMQNGASTGIALGQWETASQGE